MSFNHFHFRAGSVSIAAALSIAISGCFDLGLAADGEAGIFRFGSVSEDFFNQFDQPLAVGATMVVTVHDVANNRAVEVSEATFVDDTVFSVDDITDYRVTVSGVAEGEAILSVDGTTSEGEAMRDTVVLRTVVPEVLQMRHSCTDSESARYLAGTEIYVPFDLEMESGQSVSGKGFFPVESNDVEGAKFDATRSGENHFFFALGTEAGDVELNSTINAKSLAVTVVSVAAIDSISTRTDFASVEAVVGSSFVFDFFPSVDGERLCQAKPTRTAVSETPDICTVVEVAPSQLRTGEFEMGRFGDTQIIVVEENYVGVDAIAQGECRFTVAYPDANDGAGVSESVQFTIAAEALAP